jgi:hypothetical protein
MVNLDKAKGGGESVQTSLRSIVFVTADQLSAVVKTCTLRRLDRMHPRIGVSSVFTLSFCCGADPTPRLSDMSRVNCHPFCSRVKEGCGITPSEFQQRSHALSPLFCTTNTSAMPDGLGAPVIMDLSTQPSQSEGAICTSLWAECILLQRSSRCPSLQFYF